MDPICWKVASVIDAHTHYRGREPIAHYIENIAIANHSKSVVLSWRGLPNDTSEGDFSTIYRFAPAFRKDHPGRFYVFGGLAHDPGNVLKGDGRYLACQVEEMVASGFDGMKMMEGSPYFKKALPHPLDHEYYRPFWDAAESHAMPITIHLANPMDCWNRDASRDIYRDAEPQEEYFRQAEAVLDAHPRLPITFAHFMFMGPQLKRLDRLFSRYPEMRVDLAMGQEYMYYLSDDIASARQFFIRWQNRILYGTDISDSNSVTLARAKADQVRLFLEHDGAFQSPYALASGKPEMAGSNGRIELRGMNLPLDVLRKVLGGNAEAWLARHQG